MVLCASCNVFPQAGMEYMRPCSPWPSALSEATSHAVASTTANTEGSLSFVQCAVITVPSFRCAGIEARAPAAIIGGRGQALLMSSFCSCLHVCNCIHCSSIEHILLPVESFLSFTLSNFKILTKNLSFIFTVNKFMHVIILHMQAYQH
jgi:hypothetical protein